LAQDLRDAVRKAGLSMQINYYEGYFYMCLLEHALRSIEGPLTKSKIIHFFENLKDVDFKGIKLNFNAANRELARNVWIYTGRDNPWIEKSVDDEKRK
jgi:hypothetical protein